MITFSYSLAYQLQGLLLNCEFLKLSVQTLQPLIVIFRRGNFLYNHWGCTSIYRQLSYPFRFLYVCPFLTDICVCHGSFKNVETHEFSLAHQVTTQKRNSDTKFKIGPGQKNNHLRGFSQSTWSSIETSPYPFIFQKKRTGLVSVRQVRLDQIILDTWYPHRVRALNVQVLHGQGISQAQRRTQVG